MQLTRDQKCWVLSIGLHALVMLIFFVSFPKKVATPEIIQVPLNIQRVHEIPQPKVSSKKKVSKKALPKATKKPKPTSLPGDRIQPAVSQKSAPIYPKSALNNDWEGTVKVRVSIASNGQVTGIKIVSSSGHAILDQAFIRSIKKNYQFNPKRQMGKNIAGTMVLSHTFSLKEAN